MTIDRPDIEERYGRALESSHLRPNSEQTGDVDLLIAAGWVSDSLGTMLYRLRLEYDATRGEQQLAAGNLRHAETISRGLLKDAERQDKADAKVPCGPPLAGRYRRAAFLVMEQARAELAAETVLAVMRLRTLDPAKKALGQFATGEAIRKRFNEPESVVFAVAGKALAFWLDPLCPHCNGRGFFGGHGSPLTWCEHCGGTKHKRVRLGDDDLKHEFGRRLLVCMDNKTDYVAHMMRKWLRRQG